MDSTGGIGYPLATYRYVRLCLIAVVAGLLASVTLTGAPQGCWQTSISAFYFTATHAVFIGALCAAGLGMIAYKGVTSPEDILLNAVRRMLPRSTLGRQMLTKLKVYAGDTHPHAAQKPEALNLAQ